MGSRLADEYNPVAPYFGDPDDLEPRLMPELKPPADWTQIEEQIRLLILSAGTARRDRLYSITREIMRLSKRANELAAFKNPEFVRK